jgi:GrpB-like predicted nucleotidyltransferase (UPF0157 family)
MRVTRYRLRRGSGGAGLAAGGEGIERDLLMLEDVTLSLITERRVSQPWGLAGGEPGAVGENWLLPGGDESRATRLPDKCTIHLAAGDVLRMLTPGGGGWGRPPGPVDGLTVLGDSDGADVRIVDYDESWPARFEIERARIDGALGPVARRVEHVGSTAVPGLAAKPIVDISVGVDDPDDDAVFVPQLTAAGYVLRVIEPAHRMFRTPDRSVHLHVWRDGSDGQIDQLVFRDWLRAHGDDLARYEAVKRELAARQWGSMGDYADAKSDVVADIMERAEAGGTDVSTERRSNS